MSNNTSNQTIPDQAVIQDRTQKKYLPIQDINSIFNVDKNLFNIGLLIIGILIVVFILLKTGVSLKSIGLVVIRMDYKYVITFILAAFALNYLVSLRWAMIVKQCYDHNRVEKGYYTYYSALGLLINSIIPHIGNWGLRTASLRLLYKIPIRLGFFSIIYDKIFDLVLIFILIIPSFLYFFDIISFKFTIFLIVFCKLSFIIITIICPEKFRFSLYMLKLYMWVMKKKIIRGNSKPIFMEFSSIELTTLFEAKIVIVTILKNIVAVLRVYFVMLAMGGIIVSFFKIYAMVPLIQSIVVAIPLPGQLGTSEFGWFVVLEKLGVTPVVIGSFLIIERIVHIVTLFLIVSFHYLFYHYKCSNSEFTFIS